MDFLLPRALARVVCSNSWGQNKHSTCACWACLAACTHTFSSACSRWTQRASAAWQSNESHFAVCGRLHSSLRSVSRLKQKALIPNFRLEKFQLPVRRQSSRFA